MNLIFPDGERFFVRSVRHFAHQIADPDLRTDAKAFFKQELNHGHAHEEAFRMLEAQGFEVEDWLQWYRRVAFEQLEPRTSPMLRLATTAALEHLTASLGYHTLTKNMLADAHPVMRDLLQWHAAEEIEHKAVAFDVFVHVGGRWPMRVAGMFLAVCMFLVFWSSATRHLVRQDQAQQADPARFKRDRRALFAALGDTRLRLFSYALEYIWPGFHPNDRDDRKLAADTLLMLAPLEV
jgi:hypothetical protein